MVGAGGCLAGQLLMWSSQSECLMLQGLHLICDVSFSLQLQISQIADILMDNTTIAFQSRSVAYTAMQHEEFESKGIPLDSNTLRFITPRAAQRADSSGVFTESMVGEFN